MKANKQLLKAYEKGYRVIDGELFNPSGNILKGWINLKGYKVFHIAKNATPILFHRLVAYQKYGHKIFEKNIQVRHLDNNKLNNKNYNIKIGTQHDNAMDIPVEQRRINAGNHGRKHPHNEIIKFYSETRSYKKTMEKFNLTSKGTLNYILKKSMSYENKKKDILCQ